MTDLTTFRRVVKRKHDDLFADSDYTADFYNYQDGSYDPNTGEMTSQSRNNSFASIQVEMVPPGMDTTVDTDGTSFSWDTSIRFPRSSIDTTKLVPLGEDADRPTEVEITDQTASETVTYQLHGYSDELGSEMVMCRLIEQ